MVRLYETEDFGVCLIDCGDWMENEDIERIDWSSVKLGDIIKDAKGTVIGKASHVGEDAVTVVPIDYKED